MTSASAATPSAAAPAPTPLPQVRSGRLERLPAFPSTQVAARHEDVWVPRQCEAGQAPCQALHMHDGQMLFDARTTWNHQAWDVDQTLGRLIDAGEVPPTIVVGVWNDGPRRQAEYYPQKALALTQEPARSRHIAEALGGQPLADVYLRFLVQELKPAIDRRFNTRPDAAHTAVMGSSMGGMVSAYAISEYPQVFGAAAGLSTHWLSRHEPNAALPLGHFNDLREHLPDPATHRLWFDRGTIELDALYGPYQPLVDLIGRDRGYAAANWVSRVYEGQGHNERAWAARLPEVLRFVLAARP